ncbi:glycosyltransferase family 4 protein [Stutzerimonas nitrititolerans]|uniref:glycosyltransferase family 4 protein n=1 Tax=Stutzerimonas nitrititolerans TaxID=2482751 RepID=UPI0028A2649A|nr:glycosyltransferase family 4 protein [Stutzerimonas nitrititolerans]
MSCRRIAFVVNNSEYFVSHRIAIGLRLLALGYEVHVVAPGSCPKELAQQGFIYHTVSMSRKGKSPLGELVTIYAIYCVFRKIKPAIVHLVTIKPYLYGGIAARLAGVRAVVSAVAGLGILFSQKRYKFLILRAMLWPMYRIAFGHPLQMVIFQNHDDKKLLKKFASLSEEKTIVIRGAGVQLAQYPYLPEPQGRAVVSFASRLLKDKGVVEFVEASRILRQRGVAASFWLIGMPDTGNANTVTQAQLESWEREGLVKCLGYRKDIAYLFSQSHIVTLPSFYGEGLPKVLIEAAACGRAVVTTDHPGCRDAIEAHVTGLLVPIKDSTALADAIEWLIANVENRKQFGEAGRRLAENVFDIEKVVDAHINIYKKLLKC